MAEWDADYVTRFEAAFERAWVFVGFLGRLPEPDSYFVTAAAREAPVA